MYEFYSEGLLYGKGISPQTKQEKIKAIAKVGGGCFVVKTTICKLLDEVVFKPEIHHKSIVLGDGVLKVYNNINLIMRIDALFGGDELIFYDNKKAILVTE